MNFENWLLKPYESLGRTEKSAYTKWKNAQSIVGKTINGITALSLANHAVHGQVGFTFKCPRCGIIHECSKRRFLNGEVFSCGCSVLGNGKRHHEIGKKMSQTRLEQASAHIGEKWGRLTIINHVYRKKSPKEQCLNMYSYRCKCDCGNESNVRYSNLKNGDIVSCGCYAREKSSDRLMEVLRKNPMGIYSFSKLNWKYNNIEYRSGFEVAFAMYLEKNNISFEYEKHIINLSGGRKYIPDFKVGDSFFEIKGWFRESSKQKVDEAILLGNHIDIIFVKDLEKLLGFGMSAFYKRWKQNPTIENCFNRYKKENDVKIK